MDRWNYARDEHPPYCTCVECIEDRKDGKGKSSRRSVYSSGGNPIERFFAWLKRFFGSR